jgi:S1/P1 Nuclease
MKSTSLRGLVLGISITLGVVAPTHAYAPLGHEIVGAIADERLANTSTAPKIRALIGNLSLEKAASLADTIKGWDKKGADNPKSFRVASSKIDRQLRDFWRANQSTYDIHSTAPSHRWFHYTDVPVMPAQNYGDGTAGRSKWDIVHMIPYCVEVLRGRRPEQNERKITKPVALILLAHYVADIHQPLHVGAQYFDAQGRVADPNKEQSALANEGGNTFTLELSDEAPRTRGVRKKKFHAFWDYDAVNALFSQMPVRVRKRELQTQIAPLRKQLVSELATHEPMGWRMPMNMDITDYAEAWANEILPIAREAHKRLQFTNVHPQQEKGRVVAAGEANEKPQQDQLSYRAWAANVVREELHKAGWRLADLLQKTL